MMKIRYPFDYPRTFSKDRGDVNADRAQVLVGPDSQ